MQRPSVLPLLLPVLTLLMGLAEIPANLETQPSIYKGDSVDDIAVWVHPEEPAKSLIIGTLKLSNVNPPLPTGLNVYNLDGDQLQFLEYGTPNNVDIRPGFLWQGVPIQLIVANHWMTNTVSYHRIDLETLKLMPLLEEPLATDMEAVRGLCMYQSDNRYYYFVVSKTGLIHQYLVTSTDAGLSSQRVRRIKLDSRAEGCVVDDANHQLYVAEEKVGIWRMDARADRGNKRTLIDSISIFGDLYRDIEGITLYTKADGGGYLIASSQRKNRFVVYDRLTNNKIGAFTIVNGEDVDGVSYSDGVAARSDFLGHGFPEGIFIVHDNDNVDAEGSAIHQNFKLLDWRPLQELIDKMQD